MEAGKAGPRGSPLPSRCRPGALRSPGHPGRVSRSRDPIPGRPGASPGTSRWDSRSGLLPPVSLRGLQLPPCPAALPPPCCTFHTPRACPGPVVLCPSPACRANYTTHDASRGAASGGPRRRRARHAGSCSPRSGGGCNGPAGGTAPPTSPPPPSIPGWRLREQREEEEERRERKSCCTGTGAAAARAAAGKARGRERGHPRVTAAGKGRRRGGAAVMEGGGRGASPHPAGEAPCGAGGAESGALGRGGPAPRLSLPPEPVSPPESVCPPRACRCPRSPCVPPGARSLLPPGLLSLCPLGARYPRGLRPPLSQMLCPPSAACCPRTPLSPPSLLPPKSAVSPSQSLLSLQGLFPHPRLTPVHGKRDRDARAGGAPQGWANPPKISRGAGRGDAGNIDEPAGNSEPRQGPG